MTRLVLLVGAVLVSGTARADDDPAPESPASAGVRCIGDDLELVVPSGWEVPVKADRRVRLSLPSASRRGAFTVWVDPAEDRPTATPRKVVEGVRGPRPFEITTLGPWSCFEIPRGSTHGFSCARSRDGGGPAILVSGSGESAVLSKAGGLPGVLSHLNSAKGLDSLEPLTDVPKCLPSRSLPSK